MRKGKNGSVVIHCKIYCRNNCQFKVALFMHRIAVVVGHYNPPAWSRIWIGIGICGHSQETNEPKDLYAWQTSSSRWRQSGLTKSHQNCSLQFSLGSGFFILARSERLVCSPQSQFQSHPIPIPVPFPDPDRDPNFRWTAVPPVRLSAVNRLPSVNVVSPSSKATFELTMGILVLFCNPQRIRIFESAQVWQEELRGWMEHTWMQFAFDAWISWECNNWMRMFRKKG